MKKQICRREALTWAASLMGATCGGWARSAIAEDVEPVANPICVFTKPFNSLSFDELGQSMSAMKLQGIEAPIRKGGHVEPNAVPDRLPALVESLRKHGLEITVMTSDINDASDPMTETVLRTAAKLGIKRYRMKYHRYDLGRSVTQQIREWRSQFKDLAAMNRELGITGLYQNHAGKNQLGAALWDLPMVLDGIDPKEVGIAYDIRHATVEGGMSWPITFERVRPHIDMVYVKDFRWDGKRAENVPLGKGNVPKEFFAKLRDIGFRGPISLHEEYLDHRKPELVPQHLEAIANDLAVLRDWLAG